MDSNTRSISGHHIPFSRDSHNDAFQDMTAFTPPHGADTWLNRYSTQKKELLKSEESKNSNTSNSLKAVRKGKFTVPKANQLEDPCKKYIETSDIQVKSNKSLGTDDHFQSAVCSKNLLKVCEKLMHQKEPSSSNSNTASFDSAVEDEFDAELSLMNEKSRMEFYRNKYEHRRDSQSLPASPKMDRKNQQPVTHNPYFTITKQQDSRPESSLSFLTSLFGITAYKHPTEAQQTSLVETAKNKTTSNSSSTSATFASGGEFSKAPEQQQQGSSRMNPRPHPYREMNIFSPTSM